MITADDNLRHLGQHTPSAEDASDFAQDIEPFLAQLPPELRDLMVRVMASSVAAVARDLKVSRNTVYARLEELQRFIEQNGLAEFLRDI